MRAIKRGDIVIVAAGSGFGSKPRPALVVQADTYEMLGTIVLIPFTTALTDTVLRPRIVPDAANGLREPSDLMIDIPVTVRREKIGQMCGQMSATDLTQVDRALLVFLGLV